MTIQHELNHGTQCSMSRLLGQQTPPALPTIVCGIDADLTRLAAKHAVTVSGDWPGTGERTAKKRLLLGLFDEIAPEINSKLPEIARLIGRATPRGAFETEGTREAYEDAISDLEGLFEAIIEDLTNDLAEVSS